MGGTHGKHLKVMWMAAFLLEVSNFKADCKFCILVQSLRGKPSCIKLPVFNYALKPDVMCTVRVFLSAIVKCPSYYKFLLLSG